MRGGHIAINKIQPKLCAMFDVSIKLLRLKWFYLVNFQFEAAIGALLVIKLSISAATSPKMSSTLLSPLI